MPDKIDFWKLLGDQDQLDLIGYRILVGGPRAVRLQETRTGKSMVFVAHHEDVVRVLTKECAYSLCHYDPLYTAVGAPGATIIMRPAGPDRERRMAILKAAAEATPWFGVDATARRDVARQCVDEVLAAIRLRARPFDLMSEYGFFVPYLVAKRVLGLGGPWTFSLMPLMICLANGHPISQLRNRETGLCLTDVAWSEVVVAQLLGNFEDRNCLIRMVARWGATRFRRQIVSHVKNFPHDTGDGTLLSALWKVRDQFRATNGVYPKFIISDRAYSDEVVSIMMELAGTLLTIPGIGFSGIVNRWQKGGPGFQKSFEELDAEHAEDFVQEQLRLAPPAAKLLRNATAPIDVGDLTIQKDEYVCALVKTAGMDIDKPGEVRAGRGADTYLHFGPEGGPHQCFGHRLSPSLLAEMFLGLKGLKNFAPRGGSTGVGPLLPGRLMVDFGEQVGTGL